MFVATASGMVASVHSGSGDAGLGFSCSGDGTLPNQLPSVPDELVFVTTRVRPIIART